MLNLSITIIYSNLESSNRLVPYASEVKVASRFRLLEADNFVTSSSLLTHLTRVHEIRNSDEIRTTNTRWVIVQELPFMYERFPIYDVVYFLNSETGG